MRNIHMEEIDAGFGSATRGPSLIRKDHEGDSGAFLRRVCRENVWLNQLSLVTGSVYRSKVKIVARMSLSPAVLEKTSYCG